MDSDRKQAWTRYWRSGALHSCAGSYDGNYGGAIAAFWRAQFESLERHMRVLDLATGNGPVPALLLKTLGPARMPHVDAVDFAEPDPGWHRELPQATAERINFHANVAMEALPFPPAHFDRVVSQFGFEYARRDDATTELLRVLAPAGRVALVCHHAGSRLAQVAAEEATNADLVLADDGLLPALDALLPYAAAAATPAGAASMRADPAAVAARDRFNAAMAAAGDRARRSPFPDLLHDAAAACNGALAAIRTQGLDEVRRALRGWTDAVRDGRLRSHELCEHALDDAAADALVATLRAGGMNASASELHDGQYLIGWAITASYD